jgi:hypothetical protein
MSVMFPWRCRDLSFLLLLQMSSLVFRSTFLRGIQWCEWGKTSPLCVGWQSHSCTAVSRFQDPVVASIWMRMSQRPVSTGMQVKASGMAIVASPLAGWRTDKMAGSSARWVSQMSRGSLRGPPSLQLQVRIESIYKDLGFLVFIAI